MFDRILSERNNQLLSNEEKNTPIDTNTSEFKELSFHFNTIFNDISQKTVSADSKIYEIDRAYSLKNQYISLNFEKREQTEVPSYGWFISETNDEKKFEELVYRLKTKGLEKLENEINVGPPMSPNENDIHDIFLCKFIVGNALIVFQNDEPDLSEEAYDVYDTIIKIENDKSKKYRIRKLENIQLLYLIKIKDSDFEPQLLSCSNPNCKLNEPGVDVPQQNQIQIYYCLLTESYLCSTCHKEFHPPQIQLGLFDHSKCELKTMLNLPGECEGNHQKKEIIDFFCKDCNKGICSYCSIYGNEKHKKLDVISTLFAGTQPNEADKKEFYEIKTLFVDITNKITREITNLQTSNTTMAESLRKKVKEKFSALFNEENVKFEKEGEALIQICYQLNFIKDILLMYHKNYNDRENYLKVNKLRQELLWTKKLHLEHILYLIGIKEKINTAYFVKEKEYEDIIEAHMKDIENMIECALGIAERGAKDKEKEKDGLTIETLIKEAAIDAKKAIN